MSDRIRRLVRKSNSREYGFTLIEVIVAVAILSLIAVGIYSGLSASVKSSVNEEERGTARNLAEAQLEYAKQLTFCEYCNDYFNSDTLDPPASYDPDPEILAEYPGYGVTIDAEAYDQENRDEYEQLITVKVFFEGEEVVKLEGIKLITDSMFRKPIDFPDVDCVNPYP